jgi:hypothetical protein
MKPAVTVFRLAAIVTIAIGLSGCFVGKREFISAAEADFPYEEITFVELGQKEPTTLVRKDGAYRSLEEDNDAQIRLKRVAPDTYVAQAAGKEDGKMVYLFTTLKVDNSANVVRAYKSIAEDDDEGPGLYTCQEDNICFDSLKPYVDHALKAIADKEDPDATYRILSVK